MIFIYNNNQYMGSKYVNSKLFDVILAILFVLMLLSVSVCWVFFDFWM